jgi:hypothetical protein
VIPSASTRVLAPRPGDWADQHGSTKDHLGKAFGAIPKELRDQLTEPIASNPRAGIKVGSNVGASRDRQIKHLRMKRSITSAFSCSARIRPCNQTPLQKRLPR